MQKLLESLLDETWPYKPKIIQRSQAVSILTYIQEIPGSNLDRDTIISCGVLFCDFTPSRRLLGYLLKSGDTRFFPQTFQVIIRQHPTIRCNRVVPASLNKLQEKQERISVLKFSWMMLLF
jgi:hypothetical protein